MTRKKGVDGGSPRRLACGSLVRRAQSRGEWPGVRRTFLRGLEGMEVCVGGGVREEEGGEVDERLEEAGVRFGSGPRGGGDIRDAVALVVRVD